MNDVIRQIRERNDRIRLNLPNSEGARFLITQGVNHLDEAAKERIFQAVRTFDNFTDDNDPHGEHDFGAIELEGIPKVYWKIDYFEDAEMTTPKRPDWGERPEDFINAYRLFTVMFASEY